MTLLNEVQNNLFISILRQHYVYFSFHFIVIVPSIKTPLSSHSSILWLKRSGFANGTPWPILHIVIRVQFGLLETISYADFLIIIFPFLQTFVTIDPFPLIF